MIRTIRLFLVLEAALFLAAALIHSGHLVPGYEHRQARIAEGAIGIALLAGLACAWMRPAWTRQAGLAAQGFALLGTLIGAFTIAIGVGPRTAPDIIFHLGLLLVLAWGLAVAVRARPDARERAR